MCSEDGSGGFGEWRERQLLRDDEVYPIWTQGVASSSLNVCVHSSFIIFIEFYDLMSLIG